jgi:hypothetical protein
LILGRQKTHGSDRYALEVFMNFGLLAIAALISLSSFAFADSPAQPRDPRREWFLD